MKKLAVKIFAWILFVNISLFSIIPILNSYGAATEINPLFGDAPVINGNIDDSTGEWKEATKIQINLNDLPVKLWVMQTNLELYVAVQFDLLHEYHSVNEFVGLIISKNSSESQENFIDAKIIQFSNITGGNFSYLDYHIKNSIFLNDTISNGEGAAKLEGITSIYEFSIPINQFSFNDEDAILNDDNGYVFNITYGETQLYPQGVKKSEIVLINIIDFTAEEILLIDLTFVLSISVFSIIGVLFGFYIYKIFKLKEVIERLKR
ncbi:hypothetical protein LCGC14_0480590 [marine sediment metagenome]|uniref:Carbohydrate-binding domain-containing protein n=1 Tax=marine sediment metagenome TaxID=412755 RepID=A0A0F9VI68_9ZZZZ|nr:hypothetical protein [bacterium]